MVITSYEKSAGLIDDYLTLSRVRNHACWFLRSSTKVSYKQIVCYSILTILILFGLRRRHVLENDFHRPFTGQDFPDYMQDSSINNATERPSTNFTDLSALDFRPRNSNNVVEPSDLVGTKSQSYSPYPDYNGREWRQKWQGKYHSCLGPLGKEVDSERDQDLKSHRTEHPSKLLTSQHLDTCHL